MKKVIALLLAFLMLIILSACGKNADSEATVSTATASDTTAASTSGGFRVGYGKANITPESGVPLGGYGRSDQRISTGALSYLWATCIAITDADDNTILLYGLDLLNSAEAHGKFAADVSEATGVPVENIVMSASHSHSAPDYSYTNIPGVNEALQVLKKGLVKAAVAAMEDRKPATMSGGSIQTEGLNFVRHYIMNDGTYCGDNFGDASSGYAGHATQADPTLQLIKFSREGGKDVYMTNFQTHPHRTGGSAQYSVSADIVGEYRDVMEAELDCHVVYFSGAGGNINPISRISSENITVDFRDQGKALARYARMVELKPLQTGKVQVSKRTFEAEVNHEFDTFADCCRDIYEKWSAGELSYEGAVKEAAAQGIKINSPYQAHYIHVRAGMERSASFPIWTYSFGEVGFVAAPYEMFDTNGIYIREKSPFTMTMIATIANKTNGYFPSQLAFDYGCYEVDTANFVRGTAERAADEFVNMLTEQYNNK